MFVVSHVILTFVLSMILVALLVGVFGWRRPGRPDDTWLAVIMLFVVLFLGIWAGSLWVTPVGPAFLGVSWIPMIFVGLVLALVLAVAATPSRPRPGRETRIVPEQNPPEKSSVDALFWILLVLLFAFIAIGYVRA